MTEIADTPVRPADPVVESDELYYQVAVPRSWAEWLVIAARDRIHEDLIRHCRPTRNDQILDVGVSDVVNDAANVLERKYPHQDRITAAGLGGGVAFNAAYPKIAYHRIEANQPLPFPDKSFDIAVSNAVLEHLGGEQYQAAFVRELTRVARRVFITVPNRYFPIEHHTAIPLLHFWKRGFELACKWLGKTEWADERRLILMSRSRLASLVPAGPAPAIGYTGIMLGRLSSNLFLFIDDSTATRQRTPEAHGDGR